MLCLFGRCEKTSVYGILTSVSSTGNPVDIFARLCLPDLLVDFSMMSDLTRTLGFDNS